MGQLEKELKEIEERTTDQVVVILINDMEGKTIEEFSLKLANRLGIGQAGKNNGILILFAFKDRQLRIQVGLGLEKCGDRRFRFDHH